MNKIRWILLASFVIAILVCISGFVFSRCVGFASRLLQNPPRKALPSSATDIHEYNWDHYFPPDYFYCLKARITHGEFEAYRTKLKFVPTSKGIKETVYWTAWNEMVKKSWWDPLPDANGTFYDPTTTGSQRAFMKHENGYLYYMEMAGF